MTPLSLSECEGRVRKHLEAGDLALLLDFDGTLAPIVARAGEAEASPEARRAVSRLVRAGVPVAVISGRSLADVRARLGITDIYYAGNHGLEIEGPGVARRHAEAVRARDRLSAVRQALEARLSAVPGAWVEDKGLSLSVHYRETPAERWEEVEGAVRAGAGADLEVRSGKRVWEVRPRVDWDKGRAVEFLLESWGRPGLWPLYIGDDETDEDAFRALGDRGLGVRVTEDPSAPTAAGAWVRDPAEVEAFLIRLADEADGPR